MEICIDFDGTCVTHDYPEIGKDIGAIPILKRLVEEGHRLILFTMRSSGELKEAVSWFNENGIQLYGINVNPTQHMWTSSQKAYGQLYIDDAALGCPLKSDTNLSHRWFVDWKRIEQLLIKRGLIK